MIIIIIIFLLRFCKIFYILYNIILNFLFWSISIDINIAYTMVGLYRFLFFPYFYFFYYYYFL